MLSKSPTKQNSFTWTKSSCSSSALSPSYSEEAQSKTDPCYLGPGSATLDKRNFTKLVIKGDMNLHLGGVLALFLPFPWLKVLRFSEVNVLLLKKEKGWGSRGSR